MAQDKHGADAYAQSMHARTFHQGPPQDVQPLPGAACLIALDPGLLLVWLGLSMASCTQCAASPAGQDGERKLSSDDVFQKTSARSRAVEPSSSSNVIPTRARPGLAGLRPQMASCAKGAGSPAEKDGERIVGGRSVQGYLAQKKTPTPLGPL